MASSAPVAMRDRANQPGFLFGVGLGLRLAGSGTRSIDRVWFQEDVEFLVSGRQSFWEGAAVVFRHAVFPLEEVGDALGFDAHFDAAQACEQKIHFVTEAGGSAKILR